MCVCRVNIIYHVTLPVAWFLKSPKITYRLVYILVLIWKVKLTKRIQILGDVIVVTFTEIFLEMYRFILHSSLGLISE